MNDDLISALRYGAMMLKKARVPDYFDPFKRAAGRSQEQSNIAKGLRPANPWDRSDYSSWR